MKLNQLDSFRDHHKEWNLRPLPEQRSRNKVPGQTFIFSEQDLPGYKAKPFAWEKLDDDGNPGQGRSQLHERNKRDQKRKENSGRYEPYSRKAIPKKTALAGSVIRELEAVPVKNKDFREIQARQDRAMLAPPEKTEANFVGNMDELRSQGIGKDTYMATPAQRQAHHKVSLQGSLLCRTAPNIRRLHRRRRGVCKRAAPNNYPGTNSENSCWLRLQSIVYGL
jgi:TFIIF, beta subunit N-terminus